MLSEVDMPNFVFLAVFATCFAIPAAGDIVVKYGEFEGRPVELVVESSTGKVAVRIPFVCKNGLGEMQDTSAGQRALKFLNNEVMRLTSSSMTKQLGSSGYIFGSMEYFPTRKQLGNSGAI